MRMTFSKHMDNGDATLNRGHFLTALRYFSKARKLRPRNSDAWQLYGVCLRIIKLRLLADAAFGKAYLFARTGAARGKVLRDWSQVDLARKHYGAALFKLKMAESLLESQGSPLRGEAFYEYWITIAHIGDVYRKLGDKSRANAILHQACKKLLDHSPYGLNALVRYLATLSWWKRGRLAPLVIDLAKAEGNRKRVLQIKILRLSIRLHDLVFNT